ncbi:MAG: ROK family protein [Candidatus Eisenbacteria bacterium]|uniref:ROK family protein n=1 Tax=Eiseniibacteriota bacterium TaxID=2212470 RepID=A0A538U744_UNCEI|nr:MAG: ROK family protein [Candidatus Eisenbacteria bacterium]
MDPMLLRCAAVSASSGSRYAVGLDLGGTDLKAARVSADGRLEGFAKRPSRAAESAEGPLEAIAEAVAALTHGARDGLIGVGLGSPGVIDPVTGSLAGPTPHLHFWEAFPLRERLSQRLGLPVVVDNDANLAALAEHRLGAARGARVSITVTVGTGIGAGIVVEGRVLHGARGGAGEIGHLPLGRGGAPCRCGVPDCVEPDASGSGLARHARELGLSPAEAATVFAAAEAGDPRAQAVVAAMADRLGAALGVAVSLIDPDVVVLGGGVAQAGERLLEPVRAAVSRYTLATHREGLRVVAAALGERAGVIGAGLLAWDAAARSA